MQPQQSLLFGPYRLDLQRRQLWRGKQALKVTPKAVAVLCSLVQRPGQLVTKEEVFQAVWSETVVSDAVLTSCIRELRQALHDKARTPRYLETVHRRGYRFIGTVGSGQQEEGQTARSKRQKANRSNSSLVPNPQHPVPTLVGREAELAQLHHWLDQAVSGERQIIFVTGEPGIGKTALVEVFLDSLESRVQGLASHEANQNSKGKTQKAKVTDLRPLIPDPWISRGQCIEHYGSGEAYLPILAALGQLCRETRGEQLVSLLSQQAPTWLGQMPALLTNEEFAALQCKIAGATRERMLREMAEALEVMTAERPLVLVVEDLHWSDPSTLELLAFIARRRQPARLLVIGTYRPAEMLRDGHPLKGVVQELYAHGWATEVALPLLTDTDVAVYLGKRFPISMLPVTLAQALQQRTEGNPLFLTTLIEDWVRQGILVEHEGCWMMQQEVEGAVGMIPESIRHLVACQQEHLTPEDCQVLQAASVAGMEFSAAAVAAALVVETVAVERQCEQLANRQQFLRRAGVEEWPDNTLAARYGFLHALYQQLWHERATTTQLQQWHVRIGTRKEVAYRQRAGEIAAALTLHFEQGRDYRRAVHYLEQAAEHATQRFAYPESISHLTKALELLKTLADNPERRQMELRSQISLGVALMTTKGYAAPEAKQAYDRARELCQQIGQTLHLVPVLRGLAAFYYVQAELATARELGEQLLRLVQEENDQALLLEAHQALGGTLSSMGEFSSALQHLEQGIHLYDSQKHRDHAVLYGQDPGVSCLCRASQVLWGLGCPDQALARSREALILAQSLAHPHSLAYALTFAALLHQLRREPQGSQLQAEAAIQLATNYEFPIWKITGEILQGWGLAIQGQAREGIVIIQQGISSWRAVGAEVSLPYFLYLLAEAYGKVGTFQKGVEVLDEALVLTVRTGDRWWESESYRLKGDLLLAQESKHQKSKDKSQKLKNTDSQPLLPDPQTEAEGCFLKAIEIAQKQQAKSLELPATMSLARLWHRQGKQKEAHQMLSEIYHWFTEGFDTKDLQEAKALLDELT